jgi:hypothetical protein
MVAQNGENGMAAFLHNGQRTTNLLVSLWYNPVMMTAVRQIVKVQTDGRIEILAPELRAGSEAEVIMLLPGETASQTPAERVAVLRALRKDLALTPEAAEKWKKQVRLEREAWDPVQE